VDFTDWIERIRKGDPRALARALTEIENRGPQADALLRELFPYSGKAWKVGVTGAPGAGKSTLVNRLAAKLRREDQKVAVIAVDPTSPFTGGSILGDRVRMQDHHADPGVFIRSMATRGSLGGLAAATSDVLVALEAAGYEAVLIETVGVGQAEIDVVKLASVVTVVLTPSMGDDIQTLKAGIMEIADVFAINKADQPGADRVEAALKAMLSLKATNEQAPLIVRTIATEGEGITQLLDALRGRPHSEQQLIEYWTERLLEMIRDRFANQVLASTLSRDQLAAAAKAVALDGKNPYDFADEVVRKFSGKSTAD
jgi:LAO/AO transport system kinase